MYIHIRVALIYMFIVYFSKILNIRKACEFLYRIIKHYMHIAPHLTNTRKTLIAFLRLFYG